MDLTTLFILLVLFFSITIHEISHGAAAFMLGDSTAKDEGRLSLNPLRHIDPFGTVIFPLFLLVLTFGRGPIFGWAKPVPVNPYNFRDQKKGTIIVSLAGPLSNFLIGVIFSVLVNFFVFSNLSSFFTIISLYNFALAFFNILPFPPLDGFHILFNILPEKFFNFKRLLSQYGFYLLIFFLFFGLNLVFLLAKTFFKFFSSF